MKLNDLKEKLKSKINNSNYYFNNQGIKQQKYNKQKNVKIIGITGSRGKSTVCYLIHNYLKFLGYKSVLYSNCEIDSPKSFQIKKGFSETPLKRKDDLYKLIVDSEIYDTDFIVMEINETTLERGIIDDIDFHVCLITNVNPKHNTEMYTEEEYIKLKKSFFERLSSNSKCKCIIGLQDMSRDLYYELKNCNSLNKFVYSTDHISKVKCVPKEEINCLLKELISSLDGLNMLFTIDNQEITLKTNILMPHNALNILGFISVMKVLNMLNIKQIKRFLFDVKIPGRVETVKASGRTIMIDLFLTPTLEVLQNYKKNKLINNIHVVTGSIGTNYKDWDEKINSKKFIEERSNSRKYAMNLVKKYSDYVYLTENDNASETVESICIELQNYLGPLVKSEIILNRFEAIKKAILNSVPGDVIFISGRGNRNISCYTANGIKHFSDLESVKKIIHELGWD